MKKHFVGKLLFGSGLLCVAASLVHGVLLSYGARGAEVAAREALGPENVGYISEGDHGTE